MGMLDKFFVPGSIRKPVLDGARVGDQSRIDRALELATLGNVNALMDKANSQEWGEILGGSKQLLLIERLKIKKAALEAISESEAEKAGAKSAAAPAGQARPVDGPGRGSRHKPNVSPKTQAPEVFHAGA